MSAVGMCKSVDGQKQSQGFMRVHCEMNGHRRDCRLLDLTTRQAFVESFVPAVTGSPITLRFRLPNGHQICTTGVVSYHQFKVGFGVDFTDMSVQDREQITDLIG
jgi:hypothetical protein